MKLGSGWAPEDKNREIDVYIESLLSMKLKEIWVAISGCKYGLKLRGYI